MNTLMPSSKSLSPLLTFLPITLLLLLNACGTPPSQTSASSTPQQTVTVSVGASQLTQLYEFTEHDSGKTVTYTVTSRFAIILDAHKYAKENLQVSCRPAETIGSITNLPYVAPPLYVVRYEGLQPGLCTITNHSFLLVVKIIALSGMQKD